MRSPMGTSRAWVLKSAVVTNSEEIKNKIQMLRDHGQAKKYHHAVVGWNARMDGIQGAALSVKLKALDRANKMTLAQLRGPNFPGKSGQGSLTGTGKPNTNPPAGRGQTAD